MNVIKFPVRSKRYQETEIDDSEADGGCQSGTGFWSEGMSQDVDDFGADGGCQYAEDAEAYPPPGQESWQGPQGKINEYSIPSGLLAQNRIPTQKLSPVQVIAESLGRSGAIPTGQSRVPTPVEIIANSLRPANFKNTRELLSGEFWQSWMENEEYLRRKCLFLLGGNREDAEDVLSTAMIQAFQNYINQTCAVGNMRAWMTIIVHNACMDGFRKAKVKNNYFTDVEPSEIENISAEYDKPSQSPEDILKTRESLEELYQMILKLPETLREPLLMRTVEHLSYAEIAQRLQLTEVNVRKRLQQARDQLRSCKSWEAPCGY